MSLLDWDYDDLAHSVQHRLDRLAVSFLRGHGARIHRDDLDFHGYEHVELELNHGGHRLAVRQYGPATDEAGAAPKAPRREFASSFDGRPSAQVPAADLATWLASLPAGEALPELKVTPAPVDNPFAPTVRPATAPPTDNPFRPSPSTGSAHNPFAPPPADERRRRALDWLSGDDA